MVPLLSGVFNLVLPWLVNLASRPFTSKNPATSATEPPANVFSTEITDEQYFGTNFAVLRRSELQQSYAREYLSNFHAMSSYLSAAASKIPITVETQFESSILVAEYKKLYEKFKARNEEAYHVPLALPSFERLAAMALKSLHEDASTLVSSANAQTLRYMLASFAEFEKENTTTQFALQPWFSVSRHVYDLVNYFDFVEKHYERMKTEKFMREVCEIMCNVETKSFEVLSKKVKLNEDAEYNPLEFLEVAASRLNEMFEIFLADLSLEYDVNLVPELLTCHIANRLLSVTCILNTVCKTHHKREPNDLQISKDFLIHLTTAFAHVFMSHLDLTQNILSVLPSTFPGFSPTQLYNTATTLGTNVIGKMYQTAIINTHNFNNIIPNCSKNAGDILIETLCYPVLKCVSRAYGEAIVQSTPYANKDFQAVEGLVNIFAALAGVPDHDPNLRTSLPDLIYEEMRSRDAVEAPCYGTCLISRLKKLDQDRAKRETYLSNLMASSKTPTKGMCILNTRSLKAHRIDDPEDAKKPGDSPAEKGAFYRNLSRLALFVGVILTFTNAFLIYKLYLEPKRIRFRGDQV